MAYVRQHGKQLAIVSGNRDKESGSVKQRVLFTFYSKDEALAATGNQAERRDILFQNLMERAYPDLTFDWEKIDKAIIENVHVLPDKYEGRVLLSSQEFARSIDSVVRQLVLSDPFLVPSSKDVLISQKPSLIALRELTDHALKVIASYEKRGSKKDKSLFDQEDEFHWRYTLRGTDVPPDLEEWAEGYYQRHEYETAESIFNCLVTAFDNYAEGHNYLGLIALERRQYGKAVKHFERTATTGRTLFPAKTAKKDYWRDHDTRPFMRGMMNLIISLTCNQEYERAIEVCDKYEKECGAKDEANAYRSTVYLNLGDWKKALTCSSKSHDFVTAFALLELGESQKALEDLIFNAVEHPHSARMLLGMKKRKPDTGLGVDDHNYGVHLQAQLSGYFRRQSPEAASFLASIAKQSDFIQMLAKVDQHIFNHSNGPNEKHHENFTAWHAMREKSYAKLKAKELMAGLTKSPMKVVK